MFNLFRLFGKFKREKKTVFLVDDDIDMIRFLENHLNSQWDFEIRSFDCVKKVVDEVEQKNVLPDLIISDIKMPEKSGLELHRLFLKTSIIFVTALDGSDIEDSEYTIISKPINKKQLDLLIASKLN